MPPTTIATYLAVGCLAPGGPPARKEGDSPCKRFPDGQPHQHAYLSLHNTAYAHTTVVVNPVVIVEVLSDSTEKYDRGDKFEQYQTIASLRDYVLVSQKKGRVEHFRKQADGTWVLRA